MRDQIDIVTMGLLSCCYSVAMEYPCSCLVLASSKQIERNIDKTTVILPVSYQPVGVNPSKSVHFILLPLTSSAIFAGK
jgi:hypothetical protein